MKNTVAVLDSCVLFPNWLRDTLLSTAEAGLYRVHWSQEILDEVMRNLIARQLLSPEKTAYLEELLKSYFADAMIEVSPELIIQMSNHEKDRHVLAAAVEAEAQVIVTFNLKHFSPVSTRPWGIEAQNPDTFLLQLLENKTSLMLRVIEEQAMRLKNPPMSVQELLDKLEKQIPQFVSLIRTFL